MSKVVKIYTTDEKIIDIVSKMPGCTSADIALLLESDTKRQTVHSAVSRLKQEGIIVPGAKKLAYNGLSMASFTMAPNPPPTVKAERVKTKRKAKVKTPTATGLAATVELLQAEIAQLRAWKADAETRFPDLKIPVVILQARKLVADVYERMGDHASAEAIMRGCKDAAPIMTVAVRALGEGT